MDALKSNLFLKHLDECFLPILKTPTLNSLEVVMRRNYHIVEKKKSSFRVSSQTLWVTSDFIVSSSIVYLYK